MLQTCDTSAIERLMLQVDGLSVELLQSDGEGDPVFLFHGNSGAADLFEDLLQSELGRRQRLVAVSFLGHGGSDAPRDPVDTYGIQAYGAFAAKVVQAYGSPRYWVVGQSLGGHALIENVHRFENAHGMMLLSAPPISLATLFHAFRPDPSGGCLFKGELSDAEVDSLVTCFTKRPDPAVQAKLRHDIRRTDARFRPTLGASLAQGDLVDELAMLAGSSLPVALLGSLDDAFLNADYYATVPRERLWKGAPVMFEDCGHMLHLEAPARFERVLAEFIFDTAP